MDRKVVIRKDRCEFILKNRQKKIMNDILRIEMARKVVIRKDSCEFILKKRQKKIKNDR